MVKRLVECTPKYWDFVRELRSNPRVQSGFIEVVSISKEQQEKYMQKYGKHYRVCVVEDKPAGFVGVIENDIRICTHPEYQGMGVGKFMLEEIMKIYPNAYGKVKIENEASKKLFKSLGFSETFIIFTK